VCGLTLLALFGAVVALPAGAIGGAGAARTRSQALAGAQWPMFHHDLLHTGRSLYRGPTLAAKEWVFSTGVTVGDPAIDSSGTVYVGNGDSNLYAINPDGAKKWQFVSGGSMARSCPAIDSNGTIYAGSGDGNLYAIDPDGTEKWQFATGGVVGSPAIDSSGTIYVGSYDGNLYAINPDGTEKWQFTTPGLVGSSPAIDSTGTVYVGDTIDLPGLTLGNFSAITPDGTKKWQVDTNSGVSSSPAIGSDGTVYVGTDGDGVLAFDADGTEKWGFAGGSMHSSPAIGSDGTVYVGSRDGRLYAINADGTEKWRFTTKFEIDSSPAVDASGTIYVSSGDGNLYAIDPNGTKKWQFNTGEVEGSSPAIGSNGRIYLGGTEFDKLFAITQGVPTSLSISPSAYGIAYPKPFNLTGLLRPGSVGDKVIVYVKKPGRATWSYSSARLCYSSAPSGGATWWYRYTPTLKGHYSFYARFGGSGLRISCTSKTGRATVR
jgi:outer membrane protein assembly factor BamB